jgi:transcriptional regulator of arginine metabolism
MSRDTSELVPPMADTDRSSRWEAIRRLISRQQVGTQEELRQLLAREGFEVTQATLSRDLARLGVRRVALPSGGTTYELGTSPAEPPDLLRNVRALIVDVQDNGTLVVLHTQPGAASAVARAIDLAKLPEALGTLAGDDTIFMAPSRGTSAGALRKRLRLLLGNGAGR